MTGNRTQTPGAAQANKPAKGANSEPDMPPHVYQIVHPETIPPGMHEWPIGLRVQDCDRKWARLQ